MTMYRTRRLCACGSRSLSAPSTLCRTPDRRSRYNIVSELVGNGRWNAFYNNALSGSLDHYLAGKEVTAEKKESDGSSKSQISSLTDSLDSPPKNDEANANEPKAASTGNPGITHDSTENVQGDNTFQPSTGTTSDEASPTTEEGAGLSAVSSLRRAVGQSNLREGQGDASNRTPSSVGDNLYTDALTMDTASGDTEQTGGTE